MRQTRPGRRFCLKINDKCVLRNGKFILVPEQASLLACPARFRTKRLVKFCSLTNTLLKGRERKESCGIQPFRERGR